MEIRLCGSFPKILVHVIHFGELDVLCKINHSISYNLPKKNGYDT